MMASAVMINDGLAEKLSTMTDGTMYSCYQCGTCTATCPLGITVRKLMRAAQLGVPDSADGLWQCATCRVCEIRCPRRVEITDVIHSLRVHGFEGRKAPQKLEQTLWDVYEDGNPWRGTKLDRAKWAEGLNIKDASKGVKTLLYVGCAASFDSRLQKIALTLSSILKTAGVDFGILGKEEKCCGDVVYHSGEEGFMEELIQGNVESFKSTGAEEVVAISPHCFNMFKKVYPRYDGDLQFKHYTELLADLLDQGKLSYGRRLDSPITYHDPCYLGRYHGIYEAPRKLLESIPGAKVTEMSETKETALCCGGGGGQMWLEPPGERLSHRRVNQAADTGAKLLATSCPYCIQNFEDGVKTKDVKDLKIVDVIEAVGSALKGVKDP